MENLALEQGLALQHFFPYKFPLMLQFLESNALYTRQTQAINAHFMA